MIYFNAKNFQVKIKYVICDNIRYEKGFFSIAMGNETSKLDGCMCHCKNCSGCSFELSSDFHNKKITKDDNGLDTIKSFNFSEKCMKIKNVYEYHDWELSEEMINNDIIIFFDDKSWKKLLKYIIKLYEGNL